MLRELRPLWKNYLLQSLLAAVTILVILFILDIEEMVVIASIGSTAFIVFAMPGSITARPRRVIGGHLVGLLLGCPGLAQNVILTTPISSGEEESGAGLGPYPRSHAIYPATPDPSRSLS